MDKSKALGHDDKSGFLFAQEMLDGDVTAAVNFDRFMRHPDKGFIIMEYLLCESDQKEKNNTTPYSSHPNRYWKKNKRKFLSLWRATLDLKGVLYLINYAKKDTPYSDQILLIEVKGMNENKITNEVKTQYTRSEFQKWYRKLNKECLSPVDTILAVNPIYIMKPYYHKDKACKFLKGKRNYMICDQKDEEYYKDLIPCKECCK